MDINTKITTMFELPEGEVIADNDTWILDPELYPEDIFGELTPTGKSVKVKKPVLSLVE